MENKNHQLIHAPYEPSEELKLNLTLANDVEVQREYQVRCTQEYSSQKAYFGQVLAWVLA